jgi:hypothetical protein
MFWFIPRLFARAKKPRSILRQARLQLETCEARDLPSALSLVGHFKTHAAAVTATTASNVQSLSATLTGATGTAGSATFVSDAATGDNALKVRVSGLAASSTFTVSVGGTTVGTITTDANGHGRALFTNLSAAPSAGTAISVLDATSISVLAGSFATETSGGNNTNGSYGGGACT